MDTQTTQLKVTLPAQLHGYLRSKAEKFGLTMSSYVKHLILNDVKDEEAPTYSMSPATEMSALTALTEHRRGKTKKLGDINTFLRNV